MARGVLIIVVTAASLLCGCDKKFPETMEEAKALGTSIGEERYYARETSGLGLTEEERRKMTEILKKARVERDNLEPLMDELRELLGEERWKAYLEATEKRHQR